MEETALTRTAASVAVESIGWRYLLGTLCTSVAATTYPQGLAVAEAAATACGPDAAGHLHLDLRPERVELSLQTRSRNVVTDRDVALAQAVTEAVHDLGLRTAGATSAELARPVQMLELAIDAMDIPAVVPFWKAVLAYGDEAGFDGQDGEQDAIVDPTGQLPTLWFQQMDAPRPQRNRIHFDITVAHDEAEVRVQAAIEAGGRLLDESHARAFWVLADVEGNEVCVCTWTDRDAQV